MIQNQSIKLWNDVGSNIFKCPLELGGFPAIDPLKGVISSRFAMLIDNYAVSKELDSKQSLNFMLELQPEGIDLVSLDLVNEMKSIVPSASRSATIQLCRREARSKRQIREVIKSCKPECFSDLVLPKGGRSMMVGLMSCMQREESSSLSDSPSDRFSIPQTPKDAPIYYINSRLLKVLSEGVDKVSRATLHNMCKEFLRMRDENESIKFELVCNPYPLMYGEIERELSLYKETLKSIRVIDICPVNKRLSSQVFMNLYMATDAVESYKREFKLKYLPKALGGLTDVHPSDYLECEFIYKSKLDYLSKRKQKMKLCTLDSDVGDSLCELLLKSNFLEGSRLNYNTKTKHAYKPHIESRLSNLLKFLDDKSGEKLNPKGRTVNILDPNLQVMLNLKAVSDLDITELINVHHNMSNSFDSMSVRSTIEMIQRLMVIFGKTQVQRKHAGLVSAFVIDVAKLNVPRTNDEFAVMGSSKIYVSSEYNADEGTIGTDIIMKGSKSRVYEHSITKYKDHYDKWVEGKDDKSTVMDLSSQRMLAVKFTDRLGHVLLTVDGTNHHLFVLCSNTHTIKTVATLCTSNPLPFNKLDIDRLFLGSEDELEDSEMSNILSEALGFNNDEIKLKHVIEYEEMEEEEIGDFDFDDPFGDIDEPIGDLESEEEEDEESCASEAAKEDFGSEIISFVSIKPRTSILYSLINSQSIRSIPRVKKSRDEQKYAFVYKLDLPFHIEDKIFLENEQTPLGQLLDVIDSLEELESLWIRAYLRTVMVKNSALKNFINQMRFDNVF
jgi:hypothetical protein